MVGNKIGYFCDPFLFDPEVVAEHIDRYRFAARFVNNKGVVDIGCGAGYGVHILRNAGAQKVFGWDVSPKAVKLANRRYGTVSGVNFEVRDILAEKVDPSVEVAVCFEVIEHVQFPEKLIDNVFSGLNDNGLLIISTPNRLARRPGTKLGEAVGNPHHIFEWSPEEFEAVLSARFGSCRLYGQRCMTVEEHQHFAKSSTTKYGAIIGPVYRTIRRTMLGRNLYALLRRTVLARDIDRLPVTVCDIPQHSIPLNVIAVCQKT